MAGKFYPAHAEIELDSRGVLLSSCDARVDGVGLYARRGAEACASMQCRGVLPSISGMLVTVLPLAVSACCAVLSA